MNIIQKGIKDFTILSGSPGSCPECAVKHDPEQPHNQQSLTYQYKFFQKNGRWPTWVDAMSHCSDDIKTLWSEELAMLGIDILENR